MVLVVMVSVVSGLMVLVVMGSGVSVPMELVVMFSVVSGLMVLVVMVSVVSGLMVLVVMVSVVSAHMRPAGAVSVTIADAVMPVLVATSADLATKVDGPSAMVRRSVAAMTALVTVADRGRGGSSDFGPATGSLREAIAKLEPTKRS